MMEPLGALVALFTTASPAAILGIMWYLERKRADKNEERLIAALEKNTELNDAWLKVLKGAK